LNFLEGIKTIFFDYDGTIHNSIYLYAPAFQKAYDYLVDNNLAEKKSWSHNEISHWLGFNPPEMWEAFQPNLSEELRQKCSNIIVEEMKVLISNGKSILYDGALETLEYLKRNGYHLVFISNCKKYYMKSQADLFSLDRYFETMVCSEEYDFIPKHEILRAIIPNYPEKMIIIGDRSQDIEAGKKNNIYTIGCSYGYAMTDELKEADFIINDIKELSKYF
jgi:phosphoglycolate phosphatase